MFAISNQLDNFTLYIDNNYMQSDGISENILDVSDKYAKMFEDLGFQVICVNGNSVDEVYDAFHKDIVNGLPKAIVGKSIKGKGVSFMEGNAEWHHNRLTKEQYEQALSEINNK